MNLLKRQKVKKFVFNKAQKWGFYNSKMGIVLHFSTFTFQHQSLDKLLGKISPNSACIGSSSYFYICLSKIPVLMPLHSPKMHFLQQNFHPMGSGPRGTSRHWSSLSRRGIKLLRGLIFPPQILHLWNIPVELRSSSRGCTSTRGICWIYTCRPQIVLQFCKSFNIDDLRKSPKLH